MLDADADFLFVVKPKSHPTLFDFLHERCIQSTEWIRVRNKKTRRMEEHCYRWMSDLPIRNTDDAVQGTWVEKTVRVRQKKGTYKRTFYTTFFTSLTVTKNNVQEIARCAWARWKIENECFNCNSTTRAELQAQLRSRQERPGQYVGHHQPVGVCSAYRVGQCRRLVETMPGTLPDAA